MDSYSSHIILPSYNLILTNHQGKLKMSDLIQSTKHFMEDDLYQPEFDLFIDFSDSIAISYRLDLLEFVDFFKKSVRLKEPIKVCIVYSSPNQEFLLKLYKPMAKLLKMEVEIFKEHSPAFDWMGFSEDEKKEIKAKLFSIKLK